MRFVTLFILLMSLGLHAESEYDPDYEMRVSWVKTLKELLQEIETKEDNLVVKSERRFLERFKIMSDAWADSRYNCFYGGWPSTLVQRGEKKLCQNPSRTNSSYSASSCKGNELQCQPLLFGKGLCVSFATQAERNKTFANCESKFQKEHRGNYDFLKKLSRQEVEDLRELSAVAAEVCANKPSTICKKIMDKLPDGMKAVGQAHDEAIAEMIPVGATPGVAARTEPVPEPIDCVDPTHEHEKLVASISNVANKSLDEMYESMKLEFESSPFCDPLKVVNDPTDKPSGFLMAKFYTDLRKIDFLNVQKGQEGVYQLLADKYKFSPELKSEVLPILNNMGPGTDDDRRKLVAQAKGLMIQNYLKNYKPDANTSNEIKEELAKNNIFKKNAEGKIECPFVTKDAFMKAMAGRTAVLKGHKASIKNKDQITIVDYTRPSNERRMFVIDLKSNKVLHNTWVAHGGGGGNGPGKDGLGSSPDMSNVSGSNKSSDGFIIATQKSEGKLFGPNVLLRGIDSNNSNLAARAVIIHGWGSPMAEYTAGVQQYDYETEKYSKPFDPLDKIKNTDFRNTPTKEMERALWGISASTSMSKLLGATEGCLGVPVLNVKHLDRKGRNKTQIELLRDDLPGSIIFNYSGPEMKSKYL